ncbi:toll/interleukin-1 receptor domain-containing protein [Flavobacterium silvaticum]|uniref:Toll/interleukin-1 receptor domain-containing protein n=1 Tax=Flavobacterium silvaticum TaxID=1852020 RepID=A0A972JJ71_9FLAO|nr:toll/interleukin-1 receptor domain-containing protein [Flavobacterium silvaticum]NMH27912.1 toll/interleukin-1 receptor domain-containing protein [Flavobacterium silvaticum]
MSKPKIFISHISEESGFANNLKEWIDDTLLGGIDLFVSSDDGLSIPLGSEWLERIRKSLEDSTIMLVLISHQSKNRKWIYFESGAGYIKGIPVIPICIGGISKNELPIPLNALQAIVLPNFDNEKKLIDLIAKSAGLKTPKSISQLEFPKTKIDEIIPPLTPIPAINISFLEMANLQKALINLINFFVKNGLARNESFTLTEIEEMTSVKKERKRKYLLNILEKMLEQKLVEKSKENQKTYWRITAKGEEEFKKIKEDIGSS